jgi:hypothetical protein
MNSPAASQGRLGLAWPLLLLGVVASVFLLALSWCQPVIDGMHGFRQTQTAISSYWLAHGGEWLAYETPVLGHPWSIPFEFPLYQWIVALLSGDGELPRLEHVGRLVNLAFFFGAAWLVHRIARALTDDARLAAACAGAMLVSPLLLFWSRGFMIESCAVFMAVAFVYAMVRQARNPHWAWLVLACVAAALAAVVKITTFFGFAVVVGAALCARVLAASDGPARRRAFLLLLQAAVVVGFALGMLKLWLAFADARKASTLWGISLSSSYLAPWNFGTLAQRTNPGFWTDVVFGRALRDILGTPWLALPIVVLVAFDRKLRSPGLLMGMGYVAPFLVFTNLHEVHDYYQYANAPFVTTLVGMAVWSAGNVRRGGPLAGMALVACVCASSVYWLANHYVPMVKADSRGKAELQLASALSAAVPADRALVVFGLQWDSTMPYYARRRAMMVPDWLMPDTIPQLLDRDRVLGHVPLGALVVCPNSTGQDPAKADAYAKVIAAYAAGGRHETVAGCDLYIQPSGMPSATDPAVPRGDRPCPANNEAINMDDKTFTTRFLLGCAISGAMLAGCDRGEALPTPDAKVPPAATAPAVAPPGPTQEELRAGLAAVSSRVVETRDAFAKVEPKPDARYFMHPTMDKAAALVLDTAGLKSMRLSPAIGELDANCKSMPDAGVVGFRWQVDDRPAQTLLVDRNYRGTVDVSLEGGKRLTLQADAGNGVMWCDWFSVGVYDVVAN